MSNEECTGYSSWSNHADFYLNSAYGDFAQEHRSAGSFGLNQIRVAQPPIDLVDAAVPEYVFIRSDTVDIDVLIDIGDGPCEYRKTVFGSFDVVPPNTEARFQVSKAHDLQIVSIPAKNIDNLLEESGLSSSHPFSRFYAAMEPDPEATRLMDAMWQASKQGGAAKNLWLDGLTLQMLSVLAADKALSPMTSTTPEDAMVKRAIEYIDSHLDLALTIKELAQVASMSEVHFAQAFKATTGQAVWVYVQMRRRERAEALLAFNIQTLSSESNLTAGDRRLAQTIEYIEAHLDVALSVGELAAVATMSPSGLTRAFRTALGESVWEYVQGRRTTRAMEMLKNTALPIAMVAEQCGFASQSHLTSVVRQRTGITPGALRRG